MEKKAPKIAIIEDQEDWQNSLKGILEDMGLSVAVIANNMTQATEEVIPQLEALGINFVFLDENFELDGEEGEGGGRILAQRIREKAPSTKIIGFSTREQNYVDIQLGKNKTNESRLRKILLGE